MNPTVVALAAAPLAHGGTGRAAEWTDVLGVLVVTALAAGYGRGVHELWARRGVGDVLSGWRVAGFAAGLVVLLAADRGPVHDTAEGSFTGHMLQHMLLLVVAAPLLAIGAAGLPLSLALPRPARALANRVRSGGAGRWLRRPVNLALITSGLYSIVLWAWHLPAPYQAALASPPVHAAEHLSFVAVGWLLWSAVLGRHRQRLSAPVGLLSLLATGMPVAALGAVLTLAPEPLYGSETLTPADPLADQQLAGLVMWVPMDVIVLVLAVAIFLRWLLRLDRRTPAGHDLRPEGHPATRKEAMT